MPGLLAPVGVLARGLLGVLGGSAPAAQPPPAMGEAGTAPDPGTAAPPQPSQTLAGSPYYHPTRDAILQMLGGAAGRLDSALQQHDVMRWQMQHLQAIGESIKDPVQKTLFYADPQKWIAGAIEGNTKPVTTPKGDTTTFFDPTGPRTFTAPQYGIDAPSGDVYGLGPSVGGLEHLGQLGGDYTTTAGGTQYSKRTGQVGFQEPQFQHFPLSDLGEFITPGLVGGANGPPTAAAGAPGPSMGLAGIPGAPQAGAAPAITKALGGAPQVTSGLRSPAHNAAVGGSPRSYHLQGAALDFLPPAGMSNGQAVAALQRSGLPFAELMDEGTHVHVAWKPGAGAQVGARSGTATGGYAGSGSAPAIGGGTTQVVNPGVRPRTLSAAEAQALGYAPGTVVEQDAAGHNAVSQPTQWGSEQALRLRQDVLGSKDYQNAQAALHAYGALTSNAGTMTGPAAYAVLDAFARAINPPGMARAQTIKAIEHQLGFANNFVGGLQKAGGQGGLPQNVRQQIIDAVLGFAQSSWDQANALNSSNARFAQAHGMQPADVTAPLAPRPAQYTIQGNGTYQAPATVKSAADVERLPHRSYFVNPADGRTIYKP